jgi:lipopolysaccharide export system protein LptA
MPIRRKHPLISLALAAVLLGIVMPSWAEKADRDKPINVESDRMEYDDARLVSTFIGRVVLVQGTLVIRADRLVLREDSEGYQYGVATGKPASFRQKRDSVDKTDSVEQYIEGEGLTIDYDGKADVLTLRQQAVLRRLEQEKLMDEVHGALIIYRGETEFYTVDGAERSGSGRVRLTMQPRSKNPPAQPQTPAPAQPAQPRTPGPAQPATSLKPAETLAPSTSVRR